METLEAIPFASCKEDLNYVKGSLSSGILYKTQGKVNLVGFFNSDWTGDVEERQSTFAFVLSTWTSNFLVC